MSQCHGGKLYITTTTIDDNGNMTSTMTSGVACQGEWVRHNQIY
ncbi:MAG TPA: hypothetical protein VNW71_02235 [Thermoanaerobaculia bacterium]|nr:hypothetical protein [Thermoanaerobaculia bacterium]